MSVALTVRQKAFRLGTAGTRGASAAELARQHSDFTGTDAEYPDWLASGADAARVQAEAASTLAVTARTETESLRDETLGARDVVVGMADGLAGPPLIRETHAAAATLTGIADGEYVQVLTDETRYASRTIYQRSGSELAYKATLAILPVEANISVSVTDSATFLAQWFALNARTYRPGVKATINCAGGDYTFATAILCGPNSGSIEIVGAALTGAFPVPSDFTRSGATPEARESDRPTDRAMIRGRIPTRFLFSTGTGLALNGYRLGTLKNVMLDGQRLALTGISTGAGLTNATQGAGGATDIENVVAFAFTSVGFVNAGGGTLRHVSNKSGAAHCGIGYRSDFPGYQVALGGWSISNDEFGGRNNHSGEFYLNGFYSGFNGFSGWEVTNGNICYLNGAQIEGNRYYGLSASDGGKYKVQGATVTNNGSKGITASGNCDIDLLNATVTNNGAFNIEAGPGCTVIAKSSTVSGASNTDIIVSGSGQVLVEGISGSPTYSHAPNAENIVTALARKADLPDPEYVPVEVREALADVRRANGAMANHLIAGGWTAQAVNTNNWQVTCESPERGITVYLAASGTGNRAAWSEDGGVTINVVTGGGAIGDKQWTGCTWTGRCFFAISATGFSKSYDGKSWVAVAAPNAGTYTGIAWSPTLELLAMVQSSNGIPQIAVTDDEGATFTEITLPNGGNLRDICWAEDLQELLAINSATTGRCFASADGLTWTTSLTGMGSGREAVTRDVRLGLYVMVGASGVATSPTGRADWTARTPSASSTWTDVEPLPPFGLLVAVSSDGLGMYSRDAVTWTALTMPSADAWQMVTFNRCFGNLNAVGSSGSNRFIRSASGFGAILPDPTWGEPIASWTYSTPVSEIDFTNLGGYRELRVAIMGLSHNDGSTQVLLVRLSTNNGSSYITSGYTNGGNSSATILGSMGVSFSASVAVSTEVDLLDFDVASRVTRMTANGGYDTGATQISVTGRHTTPAAHNAIRIATSGGTFDAGTIYIFGRKARR